MTEPTAHYAGDTPAKKLRSLLGRGSTGCLSAKGPTGKSVSIYIMQGEILAAESENDGIEILNRLRTRGILEPDLVVRMESSLKAGVAMGELLFGTMPDDVVMDAFYERFRENVGRFLMAEGPVAFQEMDAIFVENIQVSHDTNDLLAEMEAVVDSVAELLGGDIALAPGTTGVSDGLEEHLLELIRQDPSMEHLLAASPLEPLRTAMLTRQLLSTSALILQDRRPEPTTSNPEVAEPQPLPHKEQFQASMSPKEPFMHREPGLKAHRLPRGHRKAMSHTSSPAFQSARGDRGTDLSLFEDNEAHRAGGEFTLEKELLDYVDLAHPSTAGREPAGGDSDVILADEASQHDLQNAAAVSLRFTGPTLTRNDALTKISVTSDVLCEICSTIDREGGSGSGQALLALLLEGAPSSFAPLFHGVEPAIDGSLDPGLILTNLYRRPQSEHRRLLNEAFRDLINRALSLSLETLDEETVDAMLERIAGFQNRLGL